MNLRCVISGGISISIVVFLLLMAGCSSDHEESNSSKRHLAGIGFSESSLIIQDPVTIQLTGSEIYAGNRFLNTVDWELRQPRDLSNSRVITTANSDASYVNFRYTCNGETKTSRVSPRDGKITDTINWNCTHLLKTKIEAVTPDTITVYEFEIDISFLNNLGN